MLSTTSAKFNGISLGASGGGNYSSLKDASATDSLHQLGANGKLYVGLCKSLFDTLFVGVEGFGRYAFFKKTEKESTMVDAGPQFGAYIKAGIQPTENILIYGLYGFQTNGAKLKEAAKAVFAESKESWNTILGGGVEYSFGLGAAARLEVTYEPEISFKFKDAAQQDYQAKFFNVNVGIILYI